MVRVDVAGRDRLDAEVLGEVAQEAEPARVSALERALELDVEALPPECAREPRRRVRIEEPETAARAAREADEPLVQLGDGLERDRRRQRLAVLSPRSAGPRMRRRQQAAEVRVAAPRLDEQRDVRAAVERDLRARDRADAERLRRVRELERAVDAVVVRERERLVPELGGARGELLRLRRSVEERVRRVAVELDVASSRLQILLEIGAGEVILRSGKLDVDAPRRRRAARRGRGARRSRMGEGAAPRPRPARRGAVRPRRRARAPTRGSACVGSARRPGHSFRPRSCTPSR